MKKSHVLVSLKYVMIVPKIWVATERFPTKLSGFDCMETVHKCTVVFLRAIEQDTI